MLLLARCLLAPARHAPTVCLSTEDPLPRVIFTDCDGTLLNPEHQLTPQARATLKTLRELGIRVVPATGRARSGPWTEQVLTDPTLNMGAPGIFLNGCSVYDADGLVQRTLLDQKVVAPILTFAEEHREACTACVYAAYDDACDDASAPIETVALVDREDELTRMLEGVGDAPVRCVVDVASPQISKILLLLRDDAPFAQSQESLRATLERLLAGRAAITQALPWALEIVPLDADKGSAARLLLQRWGLSAAEAVALGDGENDVPLLQMCGTSVAMGNGADAAKRAAQHVRGRNDEDGWCQAIEEFVIGPWQAMA